MKPFLCCLALFCSFRIAHAKNVDDEQFVRACNAIYLYDGGVGDLEDSSPQSVKALAVKARRYMAFLSLHQKKTECERLSHLPLGRSAAESVAYIAAIMGVRPYANARIMLYYKQPPYSIWARMDGAGESVFGFIWKLYDRFRDRRIALLLLKEPGDGAGSLAASGTRLLMLKRQPHFILGLAMQSKQAFALLSQDFVTDAVKKEDFQVLRRLCYASNPILRRGARQIRHSAYTYYSTNHLPYPET